MDSNDEIKRALDRFNSMRTAALEKIQIAIDAAQLEIKSNTGADEDSAINFNHSSTSTKNLHHKTSTEWTDLMTTNNNDEETEESLSSWNRLLFVHNLFRDHFLSPLVYDQYADNMEKVLYLDMFRWCLIGYSTASLLDDIHNIQSVRGQKALKLLNCQPTTADAGCVSDLMRIFRANEWRQNKNYDDEKIGQNGSKCMSIFCTNSQIKLQYECILWTT